MATSKKAALSRTDTPSEITKVGSSGPDWMQNVDETESSLETMQEYRVLSRLKIVQGTTKMEVKDAAGGEGVAIAVPSMMVLAPKNEEFQVVPIFGFTEFCLWSDMEDASTQTIMERSFDKGGELAALCRDPAKREEAYGEGRKEDGSRFMKRYVEHLCFASMVYDKDSDLFGTPLVLSFQKGEFNQGKNWISAMMLRKAGGKPVPMWGQVWSFKTNFRDRGPKKKWWGLDFSIPEVSYIEGEEVPAFRALYQELKEDFLKNKLAVDRSDGDDAPATAEKELEVDM